MIKLVPLLREILSERVPTPTPEEQNIIDDLIGTLDENKFSDLMVKVKKYAKRGLITTTVLTALLSSPTLSKAEKGQLQTLVSTSTKAQISQTYENINKDFRSFDDINSWLKQNFDGSAKWDITSISISSRNNLLNVSIDRKKSNTGYSKVVLTVNKEGTPSESRNNVLSKNPNSKEITSGETNFKGTSYDWFLIGLKTDDVDYSPSIPKGVSTDDTQPKVSSLSKQLKGGGGGGNLIDDKAYKAIYNFETTKGKIDVKTLQPVGFGKDYDVHQKDGVIKDHIQKTIGLDTWSKIPAKFRMQIFSYMFNSDSKSNDLYRWLAGLAQALDSKQFSDRGAIMSNPDERAKAIEYIKGLNGSDFENHYDDYLNVLNSQYGSLSTQNGKAYDDAAKEKSWFVRPFELDKMYSSNF